MSFEEALKQPLRYDHPYGHTPSAFQPAGWGGLVLWLHMMCGQVSQWPSANSTPTDCANCVAKGLSIDVSESSWKLLYERIKP